MKSHAREPLLELAHAFLNDVYSGNIDGSKYNQYREKLKPLKPITPEMILHYYNKVMKLDHEDLQRLEKGAFLYNLATWCIWGSIALQILGFLFSLSLALSLSFWIWLPAVLALIYSYFLLKQNPGTIVLWVFAGFGFFFITSYFGIPYWLCFALWFIAVGIWIFLESWQNRQVRESNEKSTTQERSATRDTDATAHKIDWAYQVLGSKRNESDEILKAKYRRLAKEFHPDMISSKQLSPAFVKFAEQRFREIKDAYDLIVTHRRMTTSDI